MANDGPIIENNGPLKFSAFDPKTSEIKFNGSITLTGIYRAWGDVDFVERTQLVKSNMALPAVAKESIFSVFIPDDQSLKKLPSIKQHSFLNSPSTISLDGRKSGLKGWGSLVKIIGLAKATELLKAERPIFEIPAVIVEHDLSSYEGCQGYRDYNADLIDIK
jgi:hypothetical protein